ncbi:hypothetical protein TcasGA2_TC000212 [Tribolium castaneum]|uniref:Uncharacterized protein n=1 Tax=Tribolium castaneum TaxID=7070 RepID=D6WC66_TRICA|nr:hypothetical protein TcasGA2_TC000212 [Tribolium castaneum]
METSHHTYACANRKSAITAHTSIHNTVQSSQYTKVPISYISKLVYHNFVMPLFMASRGTDPFVHDDRILPIVDVILSDGSSTTHSFPKGRSRIACLWRTIQMIKSPE